MDERTLQIYEDSLRRCNARKGFLDRFYLKFMAASPLVRKKFEKTDFVRQKRALRASLHAMGLAAGDRDGGPDRYLKDLAISHSRAHHDVGAALYDFWLDALLSTVREWDPQYDDEIGRAWEEVMTIGVRYMLSRYHGSSEDAAS